MNIYLKITKIERNKEKLKKFFFLMYVQGSNVLKMSMTYDKLFLKVIV